jgi:16S rRNA (guanine527-N7)-methyltransferase
MSYTPSPSEEQTLRSLLKNFLTENAKLNLSALRTEEQCWIGNIQDSLPFLELPFAAGIKTLLDIGTGGGFPLLPLAICLPDATLTGLDATQKKIDAVRRIADTTGLQNIRLLGGRTENLGRDPRYRETFDIVTARAVAPVNVLLEYCSPFVRRGGHVVLWKSLHAEQELQESLLARAELSCHLTGQHVYDLGGDWGERQLMVFEKSSALSPKYPRAVGVPKKEPLV